MKNIYVVHYNEIALKGRNRPDFLRKLQENICKAMELGKKDVRIVSGRVLITPSGSPLFKGEKLSRVFGISSFAPAVLVEAKYEEIEKAINTSILRSIEVSSQFKSFAIKTTRGDKRFSMTSQELNIKLGDFVRTKFNKDVNLDNPDKVFSVEIFDDGAVVYTEKFAGLGGLPVGIQGKAVALLSGGIDSPVAAYRLMKRGAEIIGVHFHSYPFTNRASIDKVKELAQILNQYGGFKIVYLVPIVEAQKQIVKNCYEQYRVLLYRRLMFRVAQELAIKQGAQALITGENLGQVASQTMENIAVVEQAVRMPVFRPLIGYDKQEIIMEAQRIGTYEVSIQPHDDCCTLFMPKNPATLARLENIINEEKKLNIEEFIKDALSKTEQY